MKINQIVADLERLWDQGTPVDPNTFICVLQILMKACNVHVKSDLVLLKEIRQILAKVRDYNTLIASHEKELLLQKIDSAEAQLQSLYTEINKKKK